MYQTNVMEWIGWQLFRGTKDESKQRTLRMYYQYQSVDEIVQRFESGSVLSGFTMKEYSNKIMIAYGNKQGSGMMNAIGIHSIGQGEGKKCLGLPYVACALATRSFGLWKLRLTSWKE